jgi:hypothetical protein
MKHVGKMKSNSARIVVAFRTLPGDSESALVIGVHGLGDSYHDFLMNVVESDAGQQANELADVLTARRFADGSVMLEYLHLNRHLKKVPTKSVLMTPDSQTQIPLNQLNEIIAQQKGVSVDELAVDDGSEKIKNPKSKKDSAPIKEEISVDAEDLSPAQMRSKADSLYKEAARLRKEADLLDPPKSKSKKVATTVE